jgi:hypothetical protein
MPRIPIINPSQQVAVLNYSNRAVPYDTNEGLREAAQGVGQLAGTLTDVDVKIKNKQYEIDQRLVQQQEDNLISKVKGQYIAAKKTFEDDLTKLLLDAQGNTIRDALQPGTWEGEYTKRLSAYAKDLQNYINANSISIGGTKYTPRNVSLAFQKYIDQDLPETIADIRHKERVAITAMEKGALFEANKEKAMAAGEASPTAMEAITREVNDSINRAVARGVISPLEAAKERYTYEQTRLATNFRSVADSVKTPEGAINYEAGAALVYKFDKDGVWNRLDAGVKARLLEGIQSRVQMQQRILEHNVSKAKQTMTQAATILANQGQLGPYLEAIAKGETPIDPSQAAHLKHLNENPVLGGGNVGPLQALKAEYELGSRSDVNRVRAYMEKNRVLLTTQGIDVKAVSAFGKELQTHEMSALNLEAAQINRKVKEADELFKSRFPPHNVMDKWTPKYRNAYDMNRAEIDSWVRANPQGDIFKKLDEIEARKKQPSVTNDKKRLQDEIRKNLPRP